MLYLCSRIIKTKSMKKYFFALLLTFSVIGVHAQNSELKNEIGITYGTGISTIGDAIGSSLSYAVLDAANNCEWSDGTAVGTFAVEYFRHMEDPKLAVGGMLTFARFSEDVINKDTKANVGERNRTYISLMPAVKYSWVNKNHFAFYSKIAGGVMLMSDHNDIDGWTNTETEFRFMMQISPIGFEFGGKFRVFLEAGWGEQGIVLAGAKYKF